MGEETRTPTRAEENLESATEERLELRSRPVVAFALEVALILFAVLVYFGVRGLTEGRVDKAFANAHALLRIEEALGIAWELRIQGAILGHQALITATNWVYVYGHWPVIAAGAVLLYAYRRDKYRLLRDAMIISGLIGFVFFAAVPVAPPRLAEPGMVDTVTEYSEGYRALQPPASHEPVRGAAEPALRLEPPPRNHPLPGKQAHRDPCLCSRHAGGNGARRRRHREPLRPGRRRRRGRCPLRPRRCDLPADTYTRWR